MNIEIELPLMAGKEVAPSIFLVGEPVYDKATGKLRCLANVHGALALIELTIKAPVV